MKVFASFLITVVMFIVLGIFFFVVHLIGEGAKSMGIEMYVTIAMVAAWALYLWRQNYKKLTGKGV